jgi:hypothetical protein
MIMGLSLTSTCLQQVRDTVDRSNLSSSSQTFFERDSRLDVTLSQRAGKTTYREIWNQITRYTRVPLESEEAAREFFDAQIATGYHKMSARSLMDAMAAHTMTRWERTDKNGYRLLVSEKEMRIHRPKNVHQEERYAQGAKFVNELNKLSTEEQKRIRSGEYVSLDSLPGEMRRAVEGVMEALNQEYVSTGRGETLHAAKLIESTRIKFEQEPQKGFNRYFLTVHVPGVGSSGCAFTDYEDRQKEVDAERARKQRAGDLDELYSPVKFAISQESARNLPVLQRKVTVQMRETTLPDVLRYLHTTYGIAYFSDPVIALPKRANVNIIGMPLSKALDRLTQIYEKTEWEWRKSNILLIRGPDNPARTP